MRRLLVVSCVASALCVLEAQAPQQPTFRGGVDVVAVDVRVVDGAGRPVADLRPDDFAVMVDGTPRTIVTADFISYSVTADVARPSDSAPPVVAPSFSSNSLAPVPARTVILFVDEENIRAGYGKWAADATAAFVDRLQPSDRVGLVIPRTTVRIAPTIDHVAVKAALNHVVGHLVPVAFSGGMGPAQAFDTHYEIMKNGGKPGEPRQSPKPIVEEIVTDVRQRAFTTLRSLIGLLDSLRTEPGPKTIVLVSEELPVSDHVEEVAEFNAEFTRLGEAAARAQAMLYVLQLDRPVADADDVKTSWMDQESSPTRDRDIRSFGLETAASIAGGKRLLVSGRPEAPFQRVAFEISGQYLLGIRTEAADRDGKAHAITVAVRRKGVEVRARKMFAYAAEAPVAYRSVTEGVNRVPRTATVESGIPAAPAPTPSTPPTGTPPTLAGPPVAGVATAPETAPAEPEAAPAPVKHTTLAANVDRLMPRVAAYIDEYAEQMSLVIGVEHYAQWLQRQDSAREVPGGRAVPRQLVSEFALVRSGDDWDGFRNVYEVDGKPVADAKDRMAKLFTEAPASAVEQGRKIAAESARYNVGALQRNFNVPTVALFFLSAANQRRFRFTKDTDDEVGGVKVWKVTFKETRKPTIIRTSSGKDMPVTGEAWIDPVDGRVLKTHMQIDSEIPIPAYLAPSGENLIGAPPKSTDIRGSNVGERVKTTASITVTYTLEPRLGILVPAEMLETYEAPMRSAFTGEDRWTRVNCRATYSDFKRFETSARIIVPK